MTHRSLERSPQDTRDGFHLYSAQASFAFPARRSGPATLAQEVSTIFALYPCSLARSAGFFSLAGKASLVSISGTFLFLWDRVFIYRWSSNFLKKVALPGAMVAKISSRASHLV